MHIPISPLSLWPPHDQTNSQFPINIKRLIRPHLHLPHPLARDDSIVQRRVKLPAPRAAMAVAVAVVVAEEVVAAGLLAAPGLERLVDGGEEVFGEGGDEGAKGG